MCKIATLTGVNTVLIHFDHEYYEFTVSIIGKPDADYFTNSKEDAFSTAKVMSEEVAA